jgi:hypothetical protein
MENEEWGMGNGERGTGNGEWGVARAQTNAAVCNKGGTGKICLAGSVFVYFSYTTEVCCNEKNSGGT